MLGGDRMGVVVQSGESCLLLAKKWTKEDWQGEGGSLLRRRREPWHIVGRHQKGAMIIHTCGEQRNQLD